MEPPLSEKACFWDGLQGEAWFLKGQFGSVSCFNHSMRAPLCFVVLAGKCPGLLNPPVMAPSRRLLLPFLIRRWHYLIAQGSHSFQAPLLTIGNWRRFITWDSPLFPAHAADARSQNRLITWEFLSFWLPFPQDSQKCSGACCFSFLILRESRPSRRAVLDEQVL